MKWDNLFMKHAGASRCTSLTNKYYEQIALYQAFEPLSTCPTYWNSNIPERDICFIFLCFSLWNGLYFWC